MIICSPYSERERQKRRDKTRRREVLVKVAPNIFAIRIQFSLVFCHAAGTVFYSHMPMGKVWIYRLLCAYVASESMTFARVRVTKP